MHCVVVLGLYKAYEALGATFVASEGAGWQGVRAWLVRARWTIEDSTVVLCHSCE